MSTPIRVARESKERTLREVSRTTGIAPAVLSKIERQIRRPTVDQLHRLAAELDMEHLARHLEPYIGLKGGG